MSLTKSIATLTAGALTVLLTASVVSSNNKSIRVRAVRVIDGDTVVIRSQGKDETVRLACIDAPEKRQPYHRESKQRLETLVSSSALYLSRVKRDFFGRTVGKLYNEQGTLLNYDMVASGAAWIYSDYLKDCQEMEQNFLQAEQASKARNAGLWAHTSPVPPWVFRKSK